MSLRVRLTLLTSLVVMGAAILLGVVAYLAASNIQYQSIDRSLTSAITDVRVRALARNIRPVPADVYNPIAVALIDSGSGQTTLRRAGFGANPLPFPTIPGDVVSSARSAPVTLPGEPSYRVFAATRNARGDTIVTATPLTGVEEDLDQLRRVIAIAVVAITALGALLAWLLVRRSLKPVDDMVDAARAVAAGDTDRRIPAAEAGTEMGDLSEALNTMIGSLTASLAEVRESELRLRTFVSDASHEIRTPLTVIRGYSELLQQTDEPRTELERRALGRLAEESHRLDDLVTQLLTLERTASTDPESLPPFDLAVVIDQAMSDFAALHRDRRVTVSCQPALIRGSVESWRQVVTNLAQNIDRYTPAGTPVSVSLTRSADTVTVTVDDAGPGIPVSRSDEMLQRFTRMDESRSPETGGAGLGLSIVRAVIDSHDGTISLRESPLGGLRVEIVIPGWPPRSPEDIA